MFKDCLMNSQSNKVNGEKEIYTRKIRRIRIQAIPFTMLGARKLVNILACSLGDNEARV